MLGHADIRTTMIYTHCVPQQNSERSKKPTGFLKWLNNEKNSILAYYLLLPISPQTWVLTVLFRTANYLLYFEIMRLFTFCQQCQKNYGKEVNHRFVTQYYDDGYVLNECPRGHKFATLVQCHKFERLLESGINALIDGYTIEACSSFYSAYERFIEYCLRIFSRKLNIDSLEYEKTYKQIIKQSERQLGAFLFLHLSVFGSTYKFDTKLTAFRNKVIHQGYIPNIDEAYTFAEKIYDEIYALANRIKNELQEHFRALISESIEEKRAKIPKDLPKITSTGTSFYNSISGNQSERFDVALRNYKDLRARILEQNDEELKPI